jgi:aminopeptidase N
MIKYKKVILMVEIFKVAKEESKLGNLNLNEIMNTWIKQMGHPVVTIKRIDDRTISLSQNHFLLDTSSTPSVASDYK